MLSWPKEGPTIASSTILAGAGILPPFNNVAKSFASAMVKFPVMEERPPLISFCTVGKE